MMKVFKFRVLTGHDASTYNLMVQAANELEARAQVTEILGKKARTALYYWAPGTLEEELGGEEFAQRVRKHWNSAHRVRWEAAEKRNK